MILIAYSLVVLADMQIMKNTNQDLTPQELEQELFHHLIDGLKDYAIFMITSEGKLGTWNPGVKRILGYDEDEFVGKPFDIIFTSQDRKLGIPEAELASAKKNGRAEDDILNQR